MLKVDILSLYTARRRSSFDDKNCNNNGDDDGNENEGFRRYAETY